MNSMHMKLLREINLAWSWIRVLFNRSTLFEYSLSASVVVTFTYLANKIHTATEVHFISFCIARDWGQLELTCVMETIAATFIPLNLSHNSFRIYEMTLFLVLFCFWFFGFWIIFPLSTSTKLIERNHGWLRGQRQKFLLTFYK